MTGTSYAVATTNYSINTNTIIEFDFQSTSPGERHVIGWDVDAVPDDDDTDASRLIAFYGTAANNSPYEGSG